MFFCLLLNNFIISKGQSAQNKYFKKRPNKGKIFSFYFIIYSIVKAFNTSRNTFFATFFTKRITQIFYLQTTENEMHNG